MSIATLEKPKSGVKVTSIPASDSLVARMPEKPEVPSSDTTESEVMAIKAKAIADKKAEEELVSLRLEALDNFKIKMSLAVQSADLILSGTKLDAYRKVASKARDALAARKACVDIDATIKKTQSKWRATDVDAFCAEFSLNVRVMYPGLVKPIKEASESTSKATRKAGDPNVRVIDWIMVDGACEVIEPILKSAGCDGLETLSYRMVLHQLVPMITFSKTDLDFQVKPPWSNFVREKLPRLIRDEINCGEFIAEIEAHEVKLKLEAMSGKTAGKTPAEIAKAESEKNTAKAKATASKLRTACNESIATGLNDAMKGLLSDGEIVAIVQKIEKDNGRSILTKPAPPVAAWNPAEFTVEMFTEAIKMLAVSGKEDTVRDIIAKAKRLEVLYLMDDKPAIVPLAAAV